MKKTMELRRVLVGTVAAISILSVTAIAAPIIENNVKSPNEITSSLDQEKIETKYQLVSGKIDKITKDGENVTVSIVNDGMGMVFHVQDGVFVIDQKDGSYKTVSDLKEGMAITGILSNRSPMTMSIPPQTPGAVGFVINSENSFMELSIYNDELTNSENKLKLNIDKETNIVDIKGTKKVFTAEDVKGSEALVFYVNTTRSIPAQTSPDMVMILNNDEMEKDDSASAPGAPSETKPAAEVATLATEAIPATEVTPAEEVKKEEVEKISYDMLYNLRETAEKAGFKVVWTANDKPVSVEKEGMKIEISIGSTKYTVNGEEKEFSKAAELKDSKIVVSGQIMDILK